MGKDRSKSLKEIKGNLYGNLENRRQEGIIDCCKEFKFIRESNTISFNNKMNRMGLTHLVLDEQYNKTDILHKDIISPIRRGSNIVIGIEGHTGTSKSELAQVITKISQQANLKYKNRKVELFLCWFVGDIYITLMEIERGSVVWVDESPRTVGKGSRTEKWSVDNALHVIRKMENTFIFVDPKEIKVDICDLYLESAGMNFKTRTSRFMIMDDKKYYFGHIYIKLHDDEEFREWYETEKDKFIQDTLEKGGRIEAEKGSQRTELNEELEIVEDLLKDNKNKVRNKILYILRYVEKYTTVEISELDFIKLSYRTIGDICNNLRKKVNEELTFE